jgi:hypothetical protein
MYTFKGKLTSPQGWFDVAGGLAGALSSRFQSDTCERQENEKERKNIKKKKEEETKGRAKKRAGSEKHLSECGLPLRFTPFESPHT